MRSSSAVVAGVFVTIPSFERNLPLFVPRTRPRMADSALMQGLGSPGATLSRMQSMSSAWQTAGDRRCIFSAAYATMTEHMEHAVQAGMFVDPVWVEELLDSFAQYYFRAAEGFASGDPRVPGVWRIAFEAAQRTDLNVLQHLFLGINAHINNDLVFTLVDLLDPDWENMGSDLRRRRQDDYFRVNDVIRDTVDVVQEEVVAQRSPLLEFVDSALGPVDEWLSAHLIAEWREDVWRHALAIMGATGPERDRQIDTVAQEAADRSQFFL